MPHPRASRIATHINVDTLVRRGNALTALTIMLLPVAERESLAGAGCNTTDSGVQAAETGVGWRPVGAIRLFASPRVHWLHRLGGG